MDKLTPREVELLKQVVTNYQFRYQVNTPDAAQRAADDLGRIIPILTKLTA